METACDNDYPQNPRQGNQKLKWKEQVEENGNEETFYTRSRQQGMEKATKQFKISNWL